MAIGRHWRAAALAGALCAGAALAAPADDHQRGNRAYLGGDVVEAMRALRVAAQAGYAPSQALLAYILDQSDFADEAASLYRQAAEQGNADGHAGLANLYLMGRGVAKDEKAALQHFSKAADLGHAGAIDAVASAWLKGQWGLDPTVEPEAALAAVRRAAEQRHLPSTDALAQVYARGQWGQRADPAEAARWQALAAQWRRQRATTPAKAVR